VTCRGGIEIYFFFSSRRRHTRWPRDWSSDVCSSDLTTARRRAVVLPADLSRAKGTDRQRAGAVAGARRLDRRLRARREGSRAPRSEERRVGKECRSELSPSHEYKNGVYYSDVA